MRAEHVRTLAGPNIYTHQPALLLRLSLEDRDAQESNDLPGFAERLLALLPGLAEQRYCTNDDEGGFAERLREGTGLAHVVEHVAVELTRLAGFPAARARTRSAGEPGVYNVVVEHKAEHATRYLLERAIELVEASAGGRGFTLEDALKEARRIAARKELGPSTRAIVEAAERRGVPWARVGEGSLVQLGWGRRRKFIQAAVADSTSAIAVELSCDKALTKVLLEQAYVPVPAGHTVRTEEEAVAALEDLGAPVVVKPLDGRQGLGVSLNLSTREQVAEAFRIAQEGFSGEVLVEELFEGKNYRVLVVGGRMVAASERVACHVTGDGRSTVGELIELANQDPRRGDGHEKPLTKIVADEIMLADLRKRGLTLAHTPARGEVVVLRESINLSTGGEARDVTDEVHESVARLCERAALVSGLDVCGVDLVLKDISRPFTKGEGGVIELNASPGLRMHLFPSAGRRREVGEAIVGLMYPHGETARIPVCAVTGTNGKTTVTRMIGHVLGASGATVGVTTTDGIYVGGRCVAEGDTTGPQSARTVLFDPTVDVAVLETARGGIMRRGLGYDWSDVAVLT
ncbi:MAG TPA: cyanophycin synthetase, partial [Pyrinomonadaceae bacterium]|nr:cyanophycin synthetase [Pyrinomonadaceae bacterium]